MATKQGYHYYTKNEIDENFATYYNATSDPKGYAVIGDSILICFGTATISNVGTGAYGEGSASITFPKSFGGVPALTLGVADVSSAVGEYAAYENLTQTGATIWAGHVAASSQTTMTVNWIAIGSVGT